MIRRSGMVANVSKIVTFDLVRNAAVASDAITLVLDSQVDMGARRHDRLDRRLKSGSHRAFSCIR